ncbi:MAG: tRNA (adenosine(37)-N6)-threonylcarbamoyltransferase complex ATPase subunit type 1 TsaE [Candidatus Omnitrophica bacterium]|nr:tRNA (adenosine(37)-N6)-threonylcarbamoyltransferase complex ATPase subunit type 1 TsaE [Candidatus Omnitrophota bacterium]
MKIITHSAQETVKLGALLGKRLKAGDVIGLVGELGSGKTTLVKGIAYGLGASEKEEISSPSFVLIKEYKARIPVFHFDLYRLGGLKDVEQLGIEEYLFDQGVCLIEWAEKMKVLLPDYLQIRIKIKGENKREFAFSANDNKRYISVLEKL